MYIQTSTKNNTFVRTPSVDILSKTILKIFQLICGTDLLLVYSKKHDTDSNIAASDCH